MKIKRVDKELPLPEFQTRGAVAFDFYCRETVKIGGGGVRRIPGNVIIKVPEGYMLLVKDRSSTAKKKGLLITAGVVDQDYCGDGDEILLQFFNPGREEVVIERGDRIAQGVFVKINRPEWEEVKKMNKENRGGFGTTGS